MNGILPRRRWLIMTAAATAAGGLAGRPARADATPEAEAELKRLIAGRTPRPGVVKLDMPAIAENGLVVPLNVDADSPMTEADHVKAIHIVADGNPNPLVATFRFTPASGRASASTRIRLAQTQNVIALAELSNGELYMARTEVKVTIGGCGG